MKKCCIVFIAATVFLFLLSATALADDYNITGTSGTLSIPAGTHTITGTSANLSITCAPGVKLTLNGVSANASGCALRFTGTGDEIILASGTTNAFTSGSGNPGISVVTGVALTISGSGTLNATGSTISAGIGGGFEESGGTINITGGTVNATGGFWAAGIGGGYKGSGATINISGGTVTATGGENGAGIGGGIQGGGGAVSISGGTVTAIGGSDGIGGAGIGSGHEGSGGTVDISGGKVYAARGGSTSAQDIGSGVSGSGVTFTLSDGAAVFLENDSYVTPTILGTQTHYHPVPFEGNTAHGIAVPASWTSAQGAFLPPTPIPPQTGDGRPVPLWIALAGVAGAAITLLSIARRKRRA